MNKKIILSIFLFSLYVVSIAQAKFAQIEGFSSDFVQDSRWSMLSKNQQEIMIDIFNNNEEAQLRVINHFQNYPQDYELLASKYDLLDLALEGYYRCPLLCKYLLSIGAYITEKVIIRADIEELLSWGLNANFVFQDGETLLNYALSSDRRAFDCIDSLLEHGADPSKKGKNGKTAYDVFNDVIFDVETIKQRFYWPDSIDFRENQRRRLTNIAKLLYKGDIPLLVQQSIDKVCSSYGYGSKFDFPIRLGIISGVIAGLHGFSYLRQ